MSVQSAAAPALAPLCPSIYTGPAIVVTDSEIMRRIPARRALAREKELRRLSDVVGQILSNLRAGVAPDSARDIAGTNGFAGSITVTVGHEEILQAVANRFRDGDNAWADTTAPGGIASLHLWHDPSHPQIR
jgi:hypothetical protein